MKNNKVIELTDAIQKGINSPLVKDFDFYKNLEKLKSKKAKIALSSKPASI